MVYLVGLAMIVFILGHVPKKYGLQQNNYRIFLIIAGVLITLITGLRSPYVGSPDTYRYKILYEKIAEYDTFQSYYNLSLSSKSLWISETGFYFLCWLLGRVFTEGQTIVFFSMAFCTFSVCYFIYKNSEDPPTSLLIYICLGLMTFNMNGMRQAMAMSVCLFAYELAKKGKLIPFAIMILLAMQFHKTALCFAPVFFLPKFREKPLDIVLFGFCLLFFMLSMDWFIVTFSDLVEKEYELDAIAEGGGVTVIIIYLVALAMPLLTKDSLKVRSNMVAYYAVFTGFASYLCRYFSNQMLERVSYYYLYFMILLIPNLIKKMDPKEQQFAIGLFSLASIALFVYRCNGGAFRNLTFFFLR